MPDEIGGYEAIIRRIFEKFFRKGEDAFEFNRKEISNAAKELGIPVPSNLGDVLFSYRFRRELPDDVLATAPEGKNWQIELAGHGTYRFVLRNPVQLVPNPNRLAIKIPDATPEIVNRYALGDEQALLAKLRYNRLIDIFLGIAAYSLQNHLRTTVAGMGQIEIDEIYVGVNRSGTQFVVPVQAKGGSDKLGAGQTQQDIACCAQKFPNLVCRPVAAQFMRHDVIALFELTSQDGEIKIAEERHFRLVSSDEISEEELSLYRQSTQ